MAARDYSRAADTYTAEQVSHSRDAIARSRALLKSTAPLVSEYALLGTLSPKADPGQSYRLSRDRRQSVHPGGHIGGGDRGGASPDGHALLSLIPPGSRDYGERV